MKTDTRIIISIDKQFYSEGDEIRIHVWFNHEFYTYATLTILSPSGITIDSAGLKTDTKTTETFAFTCGGSLIITYCYAIIIYNIFNKNSGLVTVSETRLSHILLH